MAIKKSFKDFDLEDEGDIRILIQRIENPINLNRKRKAWEAYQIKDGNQKQFVKDQLKKAYPKTHTKYRVGDINITARVVNKRAKAYKHMPIRILEQDAKKDKSDRKESEQYTTLLKTNKANKAFKEFDEIYNLHRYSLMWVNLINADEDIEGSKERYLFQALAPYEYDLFRDEVTADPVIFALNFITKVQDSSSGTREPIEVSKLGGTSTLIENIKDTFRSKNKGKKKYSFWNSKQHVQVEADVALDGTISDGASINYIKIEGNKNNANPIDRLPVSFVSAGTSVHYPIANPLSEQAVAWNLDYSDLRTASVAQGHGQLVIKHPKTQTIDPSIHLGMHHAMDLPQEDNVETPTTAEYINAAPDLAGQLSVLKFDAIQILEDHGIKAKGTIEGGTEEFSSGFDRLLAQADSIDILEDNQNTYADNLEPDVYKIVKAYTDALNQNTFKSEDIEVVYEKPKVLISDKETLDNIEKRMKLGTILPWEKHIILNPNLTIAQAKTREEEIQKIKAEEVKAQQALMGTSDNLNKEGDDDEDKKPLQNNFKT